VCNLTLLNPSSFIKIITEAASAPTGDDDLGLDRFRDRHPLMFLIHALAL